MNPLEGLQNAGPVMPEAQPTMTGMPYDQQYNQQFGPDQTITAGMQILQQALNGLKGLMEPEELGNPAIPSLQLPPQI